MKADVIKAIESHPCYNETAHTKFARMHLPVAPRCNIQCNYCNRKYEGQNPSEDEYQKVTVTIISIIISIVRASKNKKAKQAAEAQNEVAAPAEEKPAE